MIWIYEARDTIELSNNQQATAVGFKTCSKALSSRRGNMSEGTHTNVIDVADLTPNSRSSLNEHTPELTKNIPIAPELMTRNLPIMESANATTIGDLPLEVLGNHVFKFFDFEYWLEYFVTVCKHWQLAAEWSTVDKQLRIYKRIGTAWCTIKRYKVSTLIIKFQHCTPTDLATLINASPRVRAIKLCKEYECDSSESSSRFIFPNISLVYLSGSLELLKLFPNATKVCTLGEEIIDSDDLTVTSVTEIALPTTALQRLKELLPKAKRIFPALQTVYFVPHEKEFRAEVDKISDEFGISLICMFSFAPKEIANSYEDYFNRFGCTPFCHSLNKLVKLQEVFERYPSLTLEYEQDFTRRKKQFVFPITHERYFNRRVKLTSVEWQYYEEVLQLCFEKQMLPPAGLVHYYLQREDYDAAYKVPLEGEVIDSGLIYKVPSLVQLCNTLTADTVKSVVTYEVLFKRLLDAKFEDLTPIKEQLTEEALKYAYKQMLAINMNDDQWQYLVLIDSWLHPDTSRRVFDQPCIGVQYLSDAGQAKYIKRLLGRDDMNTFMEEAKKLSKPIHQIYSGSQPLLLQSRSLKTIMQQFKVDVNQVDQSGLTLLIHAIKANIWDINHLLELGADPNFAGNSPLPLHFCLLQETCKFQILNSLIAYGAYVNRQDYDSKGRTVWPITLALPHGYTTVKYLLQMGADPTVVDTAGNTLLHLLFRSKFAKDADELIEILKLLSANFNINAKNNIGESVLHLAISHQFIPSVISAIIECGADVNLPDAHGRTPLMLACYCSDLASVTVLLATKKVDIKARTKNGESIVHVVFRGMQTSLVLCFHEPENEELKKAIQPYLNEENLQFIKEECVKAEELFHVHELVTSHITFAKYFVEQVRYQVGKYSYQLLESMVVTDAKESEKLLEYLLANGLDINAKCSQPAEHEDTALLTTMDQKPMKKRVVKKIQLLLKYGASVTQKNSQGIAPIDIDPLIETRYANGLHVDYLYACSDKKMPDVNLAELRKQNKN